MSNLLKFYSYYGIIVHASICHFVRMGCIWWSYKWKRQVKEAEIKIDQISIGEFCYVGQSSVNEIDEFHCIDWSVSSAMTMEELLESLTKKSRTECEESHRLLIAAYNGLAGWYIISQQVLQHQSNIQHLHLQILSWNSL